jgi:hypothetical protein
MGRRIVRRVQKGRSKQNRVQKKSNTPGATPNPLVDLQRSIGSQAVQRLINSPYIQTKLEASSTEDKEETEADQTAKHVMRSAESNATTGAPASHAEHATQSQEKSSVDASATPPGKGGSSSSLPRDVQDFMEPRIGADFSDVRVHTGHEAADLSDELQAQAFTYGKDVYFGAGRYPRKDELTAHELAHVAQQTESASLGERISLSPDEEKKKRDAKAVALSAELQTLIDGAVWKEIRKRVYPKESAAGVKRAKERKTGARPDLTGLGKISSLENFATDIKKLQKDWGKLSADDRVKTIGDAANTRLVAASVPPFRTVAKAKTEWKGFFQAGLWKFSISEALVTGASLSNADAAELANVALHEARHAEQHFLSARYSAGPPDNKSAATIALEQSIPDAIAKEAVKAKFDAKTDATVAALGKEMYKAMITEGGINQAISDDDYTKEMKDARDKAITSLATLKGAHTDANISDSEAKRDTLKAAIAEVERRYTLYRNIPYEANAHEVGDAAEQAFKGWP